MYLSGQQTLIRKRSHQLRQFGLDFRSYHCTFFTARQLLLKMDEPTADQTRPSMARGSLPFGGQRLREDIVLHQSVVYENALLPYLRVMLMKIVIRMVIKGRSLQRPRRKGRRLGLGSNQYDKNMCQFGLRISLIRWSIRTRQRY